MLRARKRFYSAVAAVLCCSSPSIAADMPSPVVKTMPPPVPAWTYIVTPYAWLPSINGSSTIKGRTMDVDATFFDLLDRQIPKQLFGLMAAFEARNGPFAIMTDLTYMKLGASGDDTKSRSVHPLIGGSLSASVSVQFEMLIAEAALAYEFAHWGAPGGGTALDVYGGGRFWWQKAEADLATNGKLNIVNLVVENDRATAASGDITWLDPLIGLRLRHQFSPTTDLMLRGDVGGFGAGSDFSWEAVGAFNWEFSRTQNAVWSAMIGYRALYVDYKKGSGTSLYEYDILTHGPILGVSARF